MVRHHGPVYKYAGAAEALYQSILRGLSQGLIAPSCAIGKQRPILNYFTLKKTTCPRNTRRAKKGLRKVAFS